MAPKARERKRGQTAARKRKCTQDQRRDANGLRSPFMNRVLQGGVGHRLTLVVANEDPKHIL